MLGSQICLVRIYRVSRRYLLQDISVVEEYSFLDLSYLDNTLRLEHLLTLGRTSERLHKTDEATRSSCE